MKHAREIKVGVLAIVALFLLYFGFNFLKGVNIFSPTHAYYGQYANLNGLVEQSPVYIRGYKVGQVDKIYYDFSSENAFTVIFSINKDIVLPHGTMLALVSDGLLNGSALELQIPVGDTDGCYSYHDTLPTCVVPGLVDNLQSGLLNDLRTAIGKIDSLVSVVNSQFEGDHLKATLKNVETVTADLKASSADLKILVHTRIPSVVDDVDSVMTDVKVVSAQLSQLDLPATVKKVDGAVEKIDSMLATVNSKDGTLGLLLNDKDLYINLSKTVTSADSLLVDLKANPKRYVHFSLFGKKDK